MEKMIPAMDRRLMENEDGGTKSSRFKRYKNAIFLSLAAVVYGCFTIWHCIYGSFHGTGGILDIPIEFLVIYGALLAFRDSSRNKQLEALPADQKNEKS
jgi:hypothetical protein